MEEASAPKTREEDNGIRRANAPSKSGMEPDGAGPSSINAQQLLGQAEKASAQELPEHTQPKSTGPLMHNVATEESKAKEGFAGSAASPGTTGRRATKRKQPMVCMGKDLLSPMDLPLPLHREELPPPPKLPGLDRTVIHKVATKDSKSKQGFAGNASPLESTSRRGGKRKLPMISMATEMLSAMDLPLAWGRGELPLPPKLPLFDATIRIC